MQIDVITLFPQMFEAVRACGISRVALEKGSLSLGCYNPRDDTEDRHRTVDGRPYGGGPGMVMMPEPLAACIYRVRSENKGPVIYLSPQGEKLDQSIVSELASLDQMVLLAGRYEGVDERLIKTRIDREISLGDYVIAGGELAAMVVIEAIARLLPDVLGNAQSAQQDSFADGLLDCPHYTRPEWFEGLGVPPVLLSGHHEEIARWRLKQSLGRTKKRRPDLLEARQLDDIEQNLLKQFNLEHQQDE